MNARTAGHVGIQKLKRFLMVNIKTKFPRGISDQAISRDASTEDNCVRPGPGLKRQAIEETVPHNDIEEASSIKLQAPGVKLSNQPVQAASDKRQAPGSKLQASSHKRQA